MRHVPLGFFYLFTMPLLRRLFRRSFDHRSDFLFDSWSVFLWHGGLVEAIPPCILSLEHFSSKFNFDTRLSSTSSVRHLSTEHDDVSTLFPVNPSHVVFLNIYKLLSFSFPANKFLPAHGVMRIPSVVEVNEVQLWARNSSVVMLLKTSRCALKSFCTISQIATFGNGLPILSPSGAVSTISRRFR